MTTEIQTPIINPKHTENNAPNRVEYLSKISTKLEESKGNALKPLSLRPNRSVKKNISLKPLGIRSR